MLDRPWLIGLPGLDLVEPYRAVLREKEYQRDGLQNGLENLKDPQKKADLEYRAQRKREYNDPKDKQDKKYRPCPLSAHTYLPRQDKYDGQGNTGNDNALYRGRVSQSWCHFIDHHIYNTQEYHRVENIFCGDNAFWFVKQGVLRVHMIFVKVLSKL
jgi:hypothetical protein